MTSDDDETSYIILIIFVLEIFPQALLIRYNNLKTLSIISMLERKAKNNFNKRRLRKSIN